MLKKRLWYAQKSRTSHPSPSETNEHGGRHSATEASKSNIHNGQRHIYADVCCVILLSRMWADGQMKRSFGPTCRYFYRIRPGTRSAPPASGSGRNFGATKKRANHSPEVVREGVGILLAPFLRDLRTYDLEAMKDALGIFATRARESAGSRR